MNRISINFKALAAYLFIMIFLFLAGMSIGSYLLFIFYIFLFVPLLSLIELIYICNNFKKSQEFSSEHPQKGDIIEYRLALCNESPFRAKNIKIGFTMTFPVDDPIFEKEELCLTLNPGDKWIHQLFIRCEYRGIYFVGVKRISISDSLGWIQYHQTEGHRTFYVYPRIIILPGIPFVSIDETGTSEIPFGTQEDYTLLNHLVPYREGESIKNIYWKKFALFNQPVLKKYLQSSMKNIEIYIDSRRDEEVSRSVLTREDCAIETAVAVIRYFLKNKIPVNFHFMGLNRYDFKSFEIRDFESFHKNTINLYFEAQISAVEFYMLDVKSQSYKGASVLFITHSIDSTYFDVAVKNSKSGKLLIVILNTAGKNIQQKEEEIARLQILKQYGILGYVVHHSDTLLKDLKN